MTLALFISAVIGALIGYWLRGSGQKGFDDGYNQGVDEGFAAARGIYQGKDVQRWACSSCDYTSKTRESLRDHRVVMHSPAPKKGGRA